MDRLPSEAALALSADDGGGDDAESSGKAQGEKWKNQQLVERGYEPMSESQKQRLLALGNIYK
jgi:hypothetical protein